MNILLIGSGGREHALAWKITQSPLLTQLYTLPGNPGTAQLGINLSGDPMDSEAVVQIAQQHHIDLVVIGPEAPLAVGLSDRIQTAGILVFGPSQAAAQLESSKSFAKDFMARHGIPTAEYVVFDKFKAALAYLEQVSVTNDQLPVIKASGLAAGKGVILPNTIEEAEATLREIMLENKFGSAGDQVVIEERLNGREVTVLAFSDGKTVLPMPPSQDHKRLLDDDHGPNTGGMGVFAPSPFAPPELIADVVEKVLQPAVDGMLAEETPYIGVLYAGIILTPQGFKTLEFNCRFGDPETQVVLPLLDSDLVEIMLACVDGKLADWKDKIYWKEAASVCVVLASQGYPDSYPKGIPIHGLDHLPDDLIAFHAGTAHPPRSPYSRGEDRGVVTHGGRVLGITAVAPTMTKARKRAYEGVEMIQFEGMQFRSDIAKGF
jgi:phosphoribosylamine--glycine ligase